MAKWGPGIYGAEAAARYHFGVSAGALSPWQSALLATSLPNPIKRNALHPGVAQEMLAQRILGRLNHTGPDASCVK